MKAKGLESASLNKNCVFTQKLMERGTLDTWANAGEGKKNGVSK
jgi:hypothetical protein